MLGMDARGHLDLGELLRRRAELVHVSLCCECVPVHRTAHPPHVLEPVLGTGGPLRPRRTRAWFAGKGHERDRAFARCDRGSGVSDVCEVRRTTGLGVVDMGRPQAEVVAQGENPEARGAVTEHAVDIGEREACVGKRPERDFGVDVPHRVVRQVSSRVFVDSGDECRAADGH